MYVIETQRRRDESHPGRVRWSEEEKRLVCAYFKEHIKKKIPPKKHECELFLEKKGNLMVNKDWVRIKTFVYNIYRQQNQKT